MDSEVGLSGDGLCLLFMFGLSGFGDSSFLFVWFLVVLGVCWFGVVLLGCMGLVFWFWLVGCWFVGLISFGLVVFIWNVVFFWLLGGLGLFFLWLWFGFFFGCFERDVFLVWVWSTAIFNSNFKKL